jgi:hypothetical protein
MKLHTSLLRITVGYALSSSGEKTMQLPRPASVYRTSWALQYDFWITLTSATGTVKFSMSLKEQYNGQSWSLLPITCLLPLCSHKTCLILIKIINKAIPPTGHGGPWVCETSRLPHFLDKWLTDSSEAVSLARWPAFTPRKIPGTHFCHRLRWPQSHNAAGRIRSIEKCNDLIGNQTHDLIAYSTVPQPTMIQIICTYKFSCHFNIGYVCMLMVLIKIISTPTSDWCWQAYEVQ